MQSSARPPSTRWDNGKVLGLERLVQEREAARADGRAVVQCHGCFDIVHPGHIRHLRQAKALGDVLLVSITGDAGVGKGAGRPLIPEELRAENLAALDFVDWVHVHDRPTAQELLERVAPDVYVKGREYESNEDERFRAEREAVERKGGRVVFTSGDVVFSSTALIAAMEASADPFHARLRQLTQRDDLRGAGLVSRVAAFRGRRVVVVGETIRDTYVLCDYPEVAGESPVMTLRPLERREYDGGAAIVACHLAAMGASPVLVTALPDDDTGKAVRARLNANGVDVHSIETQAPLPEKQRYLVGSQKVVKLDLVKQFVLDTVEQDALVERAESLARHEGGSEAAIVCDFGLGLLTTRVIQQLARVLRPHAGTLAGDVSGTRASLRAMRQMDLLCPSEQELRHAYGLFDRSLPAVAWKLLDDTACGHAIVSMGPDGLVAFERTEAAQHGSDEEEAWPQRVRGEHVPPLCPVAIDALGCGDALLAASVLTKAVGGSLVQAATLGAIAAAAEAQRLGNVPVSATDLRHGIVKLGTAQLAFAPAEVLDSYAAGRVGGQPLAMRA